MKKKTALTEEAPETAIVRQDGGGTLVHSDAVAMTNKAIEVTVTRLETVRRYITKNLNTGYQREIKKLKGKPPTPAQEKRLKELEIDYGTIPGVKKKFLLQPGAEKICQWLRVRPHYETSVESIPDHLGHIDVVSRVKLFAGSEEIFSGPLASCTSMESNYRFRWAKMPTQPTYEWAIGEGKVAKDLGTHKSMPVYENGVKTGKWEWFIRKDNPNVWDEHNKVRQMGEKRALVKAVRNFGALSEIFTEDPSEWVLESDMPVTTAVEEPMQAAGTVTREAPKQEEQPAAPTVDKTVRIVWPSDTAEVAMVYMQSVDLAEKIRDFCEWNGTKMGWQSPASYVPDVATIAQTLGLTVIEEDERGATVYVPDAVVPPTAVAKPSLPTSGMVTMVRKEVGVNKKNPYYVVLFGGRTLYCYKGHLFEHLAKAKGQVCEFEIEEGDYPKILGIKKIGAIEFEEGLPVVQRGLL